MSLIAAVSLDGLIAHRSILGAFNAQSMCDWCREILLPSLAGRRAAFVMDNAMFHHASAVSPILMSSGSRVQFLPAYSPQLNPIEQVFSSVKARYRGHRPRPETQDPMRSILEGILSGLEHQNLRSYYENMRAWLTKAQQRLEFI